ncbi:MAG: D-glycero-alpha-D-manno-heptose-1,7-bisphosphate 7-phosphatase [Promethearchaeota archaeon]
MTLEDSNNDSNVPLNKNCDENSKTMDNEFQKNAAVFLDRDGTINVEIGYLHEPEKFKFIRGVKKALKILQKLNFKLIVVTNQGAIAKGLYGHDDVKRTHEYMLRQLRKENIYIDAIYYCPHKKEDNCFNRKPSPGMLLKGIKDHNIDPSRSWMIGDKLTDIEAGNRAKLSTILVKTGYGKKWAKYLKDLENHKNKNIKKNRPYENSEKNIKPDYICKNLLEAAKLIKRTLERPIKYNK